MDYLMSSLLAKKWLDDSISVINRTQDMRQMRLYVCPEGMRNHWLCHLCRVKAIHWFDELPYLSTYRRIRPLYT